ncbi:MAG: hypothetical protein OEV12_06110 [Gammaproteobacteria bacterium]|nr:hypothetical protein [Gammaproteobacteria bacterium]
MKPDGLARLAGIKRLILAKAHTHMPLKIMVISLAYLVLGAALVVYLVKRLRVRNSADAG